MRMILSPAKKMRTDTDTLAYQSLPVMLDRTGELLDWMREKSASGLQELWKCNDKIASLNMERLCSMQLTSNLTPAILSYEGIAYQYMAPAVFETEQLSYVEEHLRILSAFYGVLKPMDGVTPYRLEMQAKGSVRGWKNLYEFWGDSLYHEVRDDSGIMINLASKEYSKCIEKYLTKEDTFITCEFVEEVKGKLVTKGTYAKMARGEMVRYMAEHKVQTPEGLKNFTALNYQFREDLSDERNYIFERIPVEKL